jgi:hypothetical protein
VPDTWLGAMNTVDEVFKVLYARFRRRYGETRRKTAWDLATYRLISYLAWGVAGAVGVVMIVTGAFIPAGSPAEHRRWGMYLAGCVAVVVIISIHRHLKPYLDQPPVLTATESKAETWLVRRFRALSFGFFALAAAIGLLCKHFGISNF